MFVSSHLVSLSVQSSGRRKTNKSRRLFRIILRMFSYKYQNTGVCMSIIFFFEAWARPGLRAGDGGVAEFSHGPRRADRSLRSRGKPRQQQQEQPDQAGTVREGCAVQGVFVRWAVREGRGRRWAAYVACQCHSLFVCNTCRLRQRTLVVTAGQETRDTLGRHFLSGRGRGGGGRR